MAEQEPAFVTPKQRRYYTIAEVAAHNRPDDCWVIVLGRVFDLTKLLKEQQGALADPLVEHAGQNISHWFDQKTLDVKRHINPDTNLEAYYTPMGRFIHVPPPVPTTTWRTDFGLPWWKDDAYIIGKLSSKTRTIKVVNTLTSQDHLMEVANEETLKEIQDRYLDCNAHASSYTWKALLDGEFRPMDMEKTLEENGVKDEDEEFEELGMDPRDFMPTLHVYFNDDLTTA